MKITPLGSRVIVEPKEKIEKTSSGIYLPDSAQDNQNRGTIVAISAAIKEPSVAVGDTVLFEKYGGKEISDDNKKYVIIDVKDIIAKIN
jgi:chaperonin GroES